MTDDYLASDDLDPLDDPDSLPPDEDEQAELDAIDAAAYVDLNEKPEPSHSLDESTQFGETDKSDGTPGVGRQ